MKVKPKFSFSKFLFLISVIILFSGTALLVGLYSGATEGSVYHFAKNILIDLNAAYTAYRDHSRGGAPSHFLQPARNPGSGVTINKRADDGGLIFLAGFFDEVPELRLLRRDGAIMAQWPLHFSKHFPDTTYLKDPPATDRNVDVQGALIRRNGSVVFNYGKYGTAKLSRCGDLVWTLAHPTHHSIDTAESGGYWILGRRINSGSENGGFPPFTRLATNEGFPEDLILKITEEGTIAQQISIPRMLYDNGFEPTMTAGGYDFRPTATWNTELVHTNKIGELPSALAGAFKEFEAGDLVLSFRNYNLVIVVDPHNWRVKWHQTGPWKRQHDPEFNSDGTISIFNNNVYRLDLGAGDRAKADTPRMSNIIKIDPATRKTTVVYGGRKGQEFHSTIRGKQDPTPEGGFFVTEYEAGRAFEIDADGQIVWEYINRYDADQVLEITEAKLYPASYFTVKDWRCPPKTEGN